MNGKLLITLAAGLLLAGSSPAAAARLPGGGPAQPPPPPQEGGPTIDVERQLMITDLRVVEDPVRTDPRSGRDAVWTFGYLMANMAGRQDPADFTLRWLEQWERDQVVNGRVSPARPGIRELVIEPWLEASGGRRLDLRKAPFQLLAIVNRMDLRQHEGMQVATAGEGRFVFGVLGSDGEPLPPIAGPVPGGFTVIFEYELPASSMEELGQWGQRWRELDRHPLGSPEYNRALEQVTRAFTDRGRGPGKANGSALNQIRTNEIALALPWELREFVIDGRTGRLTQHTVAETPDSIALNGTSALAELVNANEAALLAGEFSLPAAQLGPASLAGPFQLTDFPDPPARSFTTIELLAPFYDVPWSAEGIGSNEARHAFALNTCGGCHRSETGTGFLQVGFPAEHELPARLGQPAELAGFLTGIEVADPVEPSVLRSFDDLERRREDLEGLLQSFEPAGEGPGPREKHRPKRPH